MGKTRQEKQLPTKADASGSLKTIDRMTGPVGVEAEERKQLGERLQAKRDATNVMQFPNGKQQRSATIPYKPDAFKTKDRKPMGEDGKVLPPLNDTQDTKGKSAKMFVGPSGHVVGPADAKVEAKPKPKGDKIPNSKLPQADEVVKQGQKADRSKGKEEAEDPTKQVDRQQAKERNPKENQKSAEVAKTATDPAKKSAVEAKQKGKGQVSKKPETKEPAAEGTKGNRRAAAKPKAKTDPDSAVAKIAQKGAKGKKSKKKGLEEDEKLGADLDKDPKKVIAPADGADGEGDDEGKGDGEKGKKGEKKEGGAEEIVIPAVVRGNFGDGIEPKLLEVNAEALKEFVPQAIVNRNPDGTTIVLAGNMSASSEDDLKGPEDKPKRKDVPAADATAIFAANRLQLNTLLDDFEMQARALVVELENAKASISGLIMSGAEAAKAAIADAAGAEKAKLSAGYAAQMGAVRSGGKRLKGETNSRAKALKDKVKQDADSARDAVTSEFDTCDAALVALELDLAKKSSEAFLQAPIDLVDVSTAKGILAKDAAQKKAAHFDTYPIPEQSGTEDFFNGENYEKNRHKARIDAAEQVGTAYVDQFAQKAQEQGQLVSGEGLMQFQAHITESVTLNREAFKARKEAALTEIKTAEDTATTTITNNAAETVKTIEAAVKSGIETLQSQESKAREGIDTMAEAKSKAIDETATTNVQNLELQVQSAGEAITAQINQTINDVSASNNPQADMISGQLQQVLASLRTGHADAMLLYTAGTDATVAGVTQVAKDTAKEIADTVKASVDAAKGIASGQVAGLEAQYKAFDKGNTEIQKNASKGMQDSGDSGAYDIKSQFDLVKLDLEDGYKKLVGKFKENTDGFAANLDVELGKQDAEMETKAQEAYDAVNPAWVDFLLAAIDIIVMILVTAVICVALASGVGILGLLLIGAAAGAVGGIIKYGARVALTSEKASWKGLAHAAVDGAIDGAKIAASMIPGWGPLAQIGVGALAGGLKYGNDVLLGDKKFSWQGLGINIFMGGLDGAFSIIGNKAGGSAGKFAEKYMIKKFGEKAASVMGKEVIKQFADDAVNAFTDTLNGGLQNMLSMWADGKGLDFKNFTSKLTLKELATNFATNKVSSVGTTKATGGIHSVTGIKPVEMKPGMAGYNPKEHGDGAKTPDAKVPDTKKPETKVPDTKKPETKVPDVKKPDTKTPEVKKPDTKVPDVKKPDTKTPEVKKPDTKTPEVKKPDTKTPEVKKPGTKKPSTKVPDTKVPDTKVPDSKVPDTKVPDTKVPDAKVPDTKVPDTKVPDTKFPDTKVPHTKVPDAKGTDSKGPGKKKKTEGDGSKPLPKDKTKKKKSAKADENVEIAPTKERIAEMEKMIMGHGVEKHVDPDGTVRYVDKEGTEIGRMENGVMSYSFKGFGGPIVMNPDRPTTVIGKFDDKTHPGQGTKWVHNLPEGSFTRQGGKEGGLNMLDVSQAKFDALLVEAKGDTKKRDDLFWDRHNLPLLQDAFASGHEVRLLSDPNHPDTRTGAYKRELETIEGPNGLAAQHGYVYDPDTKSYKPGPKKEGGDTMGPDSKKPVDKDVDSKTPKDKGTDSKKPKDKGADSKKPKDKDVDSKKPKDKDVDSKKPKDKEKGDGDEHSIGGTKGSDVYDLKREPPLTGRDPAKDQADFHDTINQLFEAQGGVVQVPLLHGAEKSTITKKILTKKGELIDTKVHVLNIPVNGKIVQVELQIEMLSGPKYNDKMDKAKKAGNTVHESGPGINQIHFDPETGTWKGTITIDGRLGKGDYDKVVGHELNEIAGVVNSQHPAAEKVHEGAKDKSQPKSEDQIKAEDDLKAGIKGQQKEGMLGEHGDASTPLTAHDHAAIKEFEQIANELGNERGPGLTDPKQTAKFDPLSTPGVKEKALIETLNNMGIKGVSDPRYQRILAMTNLSPSAKRHVENHLYAKESGSAAITPKVVDHMLHPDPKNNTPAEFAKSGIGGGHDTNNLLALNSETVVDGAGNTVPKYTITPNPNLKQSITISINGKTTTVRQFEQSQHFPGVGDQKGPPKSTVDDADVHMAYIADFQKNKVEPYMAANPSAKGAIEIMNGDGTIMVVHVKSNPPLSINSIYIDAIKNF